MKPYFTYFIVFKSSSNDESIPIQSYFRDGQIQKDGTMHLFDNDLNATLDAIKYIMHLPRNVFDLCNLDENFMASSYDTPHWIILLPDSKVFKKFEINIAVPTLFVLLDECDPQTVEQCKNWNPLLGVCKASDLNENLLKMQWEQLWSHYQENDFDFDKVPDMDIHFWLHEEKLKALPVLFLSRQYGAVNELLNSIFNCSDIEEKCVDIQWKNISHLNTLVAMGRQGITAWDQTANKIYDEIRLEEMSKFNISVVITFPGVSKWQIKHGPNAATLSETERRVIRIIGVHKAIARGGVLIELPCANEQLFRKFDELELRCKEGTNNKYIWKTLFDLGKLLGTYFSPFQIEVLKRAKDITVFSDFPIGLAILEGDEVPLQCYKKISYRPLTPLTRQLQIELTKSQQVYLGKTCKVAMAECIINNEENQNVYPFCKLMSDAVKEMARTHSGLIVVHKETYSVEMLKSFIEENIDADILYISAHGCYQRERNAAGIMAGDEFWIAAENMRVPPIVILSACHVSPRGMGAVNIADMFIRNGAVAVLGNFIPVNAKRNLVLMTRLFTYIAEGQLGNKQYKTLSEAWCGIVASNAIHELMSTSRRFEQWMHSKNREGSIRLIDFQLNRCVGRLRLSHVYSDTITIIKEMLNEEGFNGKFGDILDMNNFFPESFFYQFIGNPENVFLYNEIFEEANKHQPSN